MKQKRLVPIFKGTGFFNQNVFEINNHCRLVKKEMKKIENFALFDYAQSDCQTERSRSLL